MATAEPLPVAALYQSYVPTELSVRDLMDAEIPIAEAVLIPTDDAVQAPIASAPPEALVLGGVATYTTNDESDNTPMVAASLAPPLPSFSGPSIDSLLQEMAFSINDFEIICRKLRDSQWRDRLASITPDEFGSILAHVNLDSDQPRVAAVLANAVNSFTCTHAKVGILNSAEWNRSTTVQKILPFCVDIVSNHGIVLEALTQWEVEVTRSAFEEAMASRSNLEP